MKSKTYDIFFIFIVCLLIGIGRSLILQDIDLIKVAPEITEEIPSGLIEPVLIDVSLAEDLFNKNAIFIDARDEDVYLKGHIKSSINIPWDSIDNDKINDKLLDIKYDEDIVIYCSGGDCTLSMDLGEYIFNELSYERVFIFEGGYPSWIENNLPINKDDN